MKYGTGRVFFFFFLSKQWAYSGKNVLKREGIVGEDRAQFDCDAKINKK
jgi:hypothetical protein